MSSYHTAPLNDRWVCVGWRHDSLWSQNDTANIAISTWYNYGVQIHNYVIAAYGSCVMLWKYTSALESGSDLTSPHCPQTKKFNFCLWQKLQTCDWLNQEFTQLINTTTLPEANSLRQPWREHYTSLPIVPKMLRCTHANWTYKLRSVYLENQSLIAFKKVYVLWTFSISFIYPSHSL